MKKTISRAELIRWGACKKGLERFIRQTGGADEPVAVGSLFDGLNTTSDLIWLAGKICTVEKVCKFARDVALINVELIKPYCIDADYKSILHLLNTGENADRAAGAAYAAYTAVTAHTAVTRTAAYAAYAAYAAHTAVTRTAAYAAAAYAAAAYAADAAAYADAANADIDFTPYLKELFS